MISGFGIHVGGGLVLFRSLLAASQTFARHVLLDERFPTEDFAGSGEAQPTVERVRRSFVARALSLYRLASSARPGDTVLCFNNLPPLTRSQGFVVVFVHAPHFFGAHAGIRYPFQVSLRLGIERLWFRCGARNADEFWVQTNTMAGLLRQARPGATVRVVPLVDDSLQALLQDRVPRDRGARAHVDYRKHEFFYPADAVGHKNHPQLLRAWKMLEEEGKFPRLVLTLRDEEFSEVHRLAGMKPGEVVGASSVGRLPRAAVLERLRHCSALVFPSLAETYGLPMLEAVALGVPIIASEREFVRDVCQPSQSFDPTSARSIARAITRFVEGPEQTDVEVCSAEDFVGRLIGAGQARQRLS